ncbi:hypothetical protein HZ994_15460 [Akkermansiaceae bacterium]|nr:hypothetical protein HZ994_15460 [Akkermansiaceae bacterium]
MTQPTPNHALESCVQAVWRRTQRKHLVSGLLAACRWGVPLFFLGMLIDRYAYLPGAGRAVILLVLLATSLYKAWQNGWRKLRSFDPTRTAMGIEKQEGGFDSLLTTGIELSKTGAPPGTSQALCDETIRKAEQAAAGLQPAKIVSLSSLRIPARIAVALGVAVLLFAAFKGPFLAAGLARIFTPWVTVAYPTKTKLDLGNADLVVKEGSSAQILVGVSGAVPDSAKLLLQTGDGSPRAMDLAVTDGQAEYMIESASRDFTYRVHAGDARSEWHHVRVVSAPRIKNVAVALDFPDYLEKENETVEAMTLTVPEDTKIRWELELDQPVRDAVLHRDGEEPVALETAAGGRRIVIDETVDASKGYSFSWVEKEHGFEFASPRYYLQVASDQEPRVELVSPEQNLSAMLGRPLDLVVRASDDHGIGETTVTFRVNLRPEKTITLPKPVRAGEGAQKIDWDYRKELPDLQVGDSVSFVVGVADRYPGENGPHRARTELRRITFLSREDYLAAITKQMERLLTNVRAIYRQERAAHELVLGLDPAAESFLPTCQLEVIRQEMIREQLVTTADGVKALLDDLAANQVSDAVESESLSAMQDGLRGIASEHVARAADLLRKQVGADSQDPQPAIEAVNEAARELGGLVLQRDIDAAREVFARETHMLARELARLRLRLLTAGPDRAESLAKGHEDVAEWTDQLLGRLTKGMIYEKRPLAVLGLNRRIHALRTGGVAESIRKTASLAREGKTAEAAALQYPLIRPLLEAEFTMRAGSEYALIRDLHGQIASLASDQQELLAACEKLPDFSGRVEELKKRQTDLRDALVLAPLPAIPAARARLFDLVLPSIPPTDEFRLRAETLMGEAIAGLGKGSRDDTLAHQRGAVESLREFEGILKRWFGELAQKSLGVSTLVSDATNRAGALEQFETRQIVLLERTEEAALDEKNPKELAEDQDSIAAEIEDFRKEIAGAGASKEVLPLIGRLDAVAKAMNLATATLRGKSAEEALGHQEAAAAALTEARAIADGQLAQLNLLQQLIGFEQSVAKASEGMADVVGGQNDLIAATEAADEDSLPPLLAPQKNLLACLSDIAPSLDLVAARLDVGTPLVFAASDVEDALLAMEDGDAEGAAEIQGIAVESLAKVRGLVSEISVQTGYVAEIVEFLHEATSEASVLAFRQRQIRENPDAKDAASLQQALASETGKYGNILTAVAGTIDFQQLDEKAKERLGEIDLTVDFGAPAAQMEEAVKLLGSGQAADEAMLAAEKALGSNAEQLLVIITMLNGLPAIEVTSASLPELHRLIAVLDIASKHRQLMRETQGAADKDLPALAARQKKIAESATKYLGGETSHPMLVTAHGQLAPIEAALTASRKAEAGSAQLAADQTLRHFILEQALVLNTATPPPSSSSDPVITESETTDLSESDTVGFVSDFVSGEAPKDKESEWEILGTRNRAALNQNFARELPLEFRATLKNYYERVAK